METNEKVYASQQLICMLPPLALKVLMYLLNWQKYDSVKYFERQMTKLMHISVEELELGIQTLKDNNLVNISLVDNTFILSINKETVKKYFNVTLQQVHDHEGLKMATKATWNQAKSNEKENASSYDDLTPSQIDKLIQHLQIIKNEKTEVSKLVKVASTVNDDVDSLPF